MGSKKIIFLVGPTAVGKSEVALSLAKQLNGEIISCDSMQVYREVHIASDKPSKEILRAIPHHLVNVVSIVKDFDVAVFRKKVLTTIASIHRKKKIPIIVGGSGLYMSILLDGIFAGQKKDERLRARLEKEAKEKGNSALYQRLQQADPEAAKKIHPNDRRRMIRALEVFLMAQKPISQLQKSRRGLWGQYDIQMFALTRDRQQLYEAINQRVDQMFESGVIDEIESLAKKKWSKTAQRIIGVDEIKDFLAKKHDLERTKYLMKLKTRHYAKRQLTWFRRDQRLEWILINGKDTPQKISETIIRKVNAHHA